MTPQIYLRKGKEESLMRRHPWIFSGAIDYIKAEDESEIAEGALVEVYTRSGEFIAQGHYQIGSIAVRVLSFCRETIDQEWWNRRIAVEYLKDIGDKYDLIILDPPAFAKHHKVLGNALQGYKRLNARAISQIKPGGILFTFSCSQAVSKELFRTTVFSAAAIAGRNVRILHQMTQPADHPISIYHPEGEYLKGLVLYVE